MAEIGAPSSEYFVKEATKIVELCKKEGVILRVMGACAIRIHCPNSCDIIDDLKRPISDLDFITYSRFEDKVDDLFNKFGYQSGVTSTLYAHMYGQSRRIYLDPRTQKKVDLFFDKLNMCHTVDFKNRLEVDFPTLSPSDILLQKMQIVKINRKDVVDTLVLISEHNVDEEEKDTINSKYISQVLAKDWGFYYTATTNLKKLKHLLPQYSAFNDDSKALIDQRINKLLDAIEKRPKSLGWKIRARIGTKRKWYRDVDEISMGSGTQGG